MIIEKIKKQGNGFLVNDTISVPDDARNRYYTEIQKWVAEGNEIEAEFTSAELLAQIKIKKLAELNFYYKSNELRKTIALGFTFVNNNDFRNTIQEQITMAETTGESYFNYITTESSIEITVEQAKAMLGQLIKIATANFVKKDEKTKEIEALETAEDVKNYDVKKNFTVGVEL